MKTVCLQLLHDLFITIIILSRTDLCIIKYDSHTLLRDNFSS